MPRANVFLPIGSSRCPAHRSDIGGFCRTLRSSTAGIGTELLAPRERIEVTRRAHHLSVLRCRWAVRIGPTRA
jgi:hypothetical protein